MSTNFFICYARADAKDLAKKLRNHIDRVVDDSKVFLDLIDTPGTKWGPVIRKAISSCDVFIIIITEAALKSVQVEKEANEAHHLEKITIPCMDENLHMDDWEQIPWGLDERDGIEF